MISSAESMTARRSRLSRAHKWGALLSALLSWVGTAKADITLAQLANRGEYIDVNGVRFEGFSVGNQVGVTADDIDVTPVVNGSSVGLLFTPTATFSVSGTNGFSMIGFQYYVQSLSSTSLSASGLAMAGTASGTAYATAEADVYPYPQLSDFNPLVQNVTYLSGFFGNQLTATGQFSAQAAIQVISNIQLFSSDQDASTSVASFSETVSASSVPEPTGMIPIGTGVAGFLGYGWYRRRRAR